MLAINLRITTVEGQLRELEAKIQEKFIKYGLKIEQMTEFGKEIRRSNRDDDWHHTSLDEFMSELEKYEVWNDEIYDKSASIIAMKIRSRE